MNLADKMRLISFQNKTKTLSALEEKQYNTILSSISSAAENGRFSVIAPIKLNSLEVHVAAILEAEGFLLLDKNNYTLICW